MYGSLDYDPEVVGWLLYVLKNNLKAERCESSLSEREGVVSCHKGQGYLDFQDRAYSICPSLVLSSQRNTLSGPARVPDELLASFLVIRCSDRASCLEGYIG